MADESCDEDVFSGDSDGYQSDSDADSDGYLSEELRPLIDVWKSMREGWWNQAGYETYWDYVQASEKRWARMGFQSIYKKRKRRPKPSDLPDASPPDLDPDALAADATRPRNSRDRQVNVRLTELGYEALTQAARAYGLRPSTLARLLIHRGALAVLEALKAESETRSA